MPKSLRSFQQRIEEIYGPKDAARGVHGTFTWFVEEVGELARCFNTEPPRPDEEQQEFADCLAWLSTLASLRGIDLEEAAWGKYESGCPRCEATPCQCDHREPSDGNPS